MKKSIMEELSLDRYKSGAILNVPENVKDFELLNFDEKLTTRKHDCIISFVYSLEEMVDVIQCVIDKNSLENKGRIYFAYPKKGNKEYDSYIDRDRIFPYLNVEAETKYLKGTDFKFIIMVSLNDTFTIISIGKEKRVVKKTIA